MNQELPVFIIYFFELVATILATIYYKKYKNTSEKYFLILLWLTVLNEAIGRYILKVLDRGNIWLMNGYMILIYGFFGYWFYSIIKKGVYKKIVVLGFIVFSSVVLYNAFFNNWNYYFYENFIVGAISILIYTMLYFSELLNGDEVLNLKSNLKFWIATGMLLFSIGIIPMTVFSHVFEKEWQTRLIVLMSLNIILYTCYSLGFIYYKSDDEK